MHIINYLIMFKQRRKNPGKSRLLWERRDPSRIEIRSKGIPIGDFRAIRSVDPRLDRRPLPRSSRAAEAAVHRAERAADALSQARDDRDANDQNQSQHDGVFHRGGTVFTRQKPTNLSCELTHDNHLLKVAKTFRSANHPPARLGPSHRDLASSARPIQVRPAAKVMFDVPLDSDGNNGTLVRASPRCQNRPDRCWIKSTPGLHTIACYFIYLINHLPRLLEIVS